MACAGIQPGGPRQSPDSAPGLLGPAVGHGTMVAGVVLGEAPGAHIRAVRILDKEGIGRDEKVAEVLTSLAAPPHDCRLFNLSFCGTVANEGDSPALIDEALQALPPDAVVVAAAGNFGDDHRVWPAASKRVIAVGAVEVFGKPALASFSGRGDWVDAYAPGIAVLGPFCTFAESATLDGSCRPAQAYDGWARGTGTSFAAAIVTGQIARLAMEKGVGAAEAAALLLRDAERVTVGDLRRPFVPSAVSG